VLLVVAESGTELDDDVGSVDEVVGSSVVEVGSIVVVTGTVVVVVLGSVLVVVDDDDDEVSVVGSDVSGVVVEEVVTVVLGSRPVSDSDVWALSTSRELIPPLVSFPSGLSERLSSGFDSRSGPVAGALSAPVGSAAGATVLSTPMAWMARGAATARAVTVDNERASRNRVLPEDSRR